MRSFFLLVTLAGCYYGQAAPASPPTTSTTTAPPPRARVRAHVALEALPPITTDNARTVLMARSVTMRASSEYSGWPATNATDGDPETSWYSAAGDAAANGKTPWIEVVLDRTSTVRRVTILGNRDPSYLQGYTVFRGQLDILDANGHAIVTLASEGLGNRRDFDFRLDRPVNGAMAIRFTSLDDEGNQNQYGDIAIAEVQVD